MALPPHHLGEYRDWTAFLMLRDASSDAHRQQLSERAWRASFAAIWLGQFLAMVGIGFSNPFLPLYIQQLGLETEAEVLLWAGLINSGPALTMAVFAPIWGAIADRFGCKPMLQRAMFGGAITIGAMALAPSVQILLVIRLLQGTMTGTVAASAALVATQTPRERLGYTLGLLQTANFAGASIGPLLGGVLADIVGYQATFVTTGIILALAGLLVTFLVQERFVRRRSEPSEPRDGQVRAFVLGPIGALVTVGFLMSMANTIVAPIIPLFIQDMVRGERAAMWAGLAVGVTAGTGALSAVFLGKRADRLGYRRVLVICLCGAGLVYLPQALAWTVLYLIVMRGVTGLFLGGLMPMKNALIGSLVPEGRRATAFGIVASATSLGGVLGPVVGASIAASAGMPSVFLATGTVMILASLWVRLVIPAPKKSGLRPGRVDTV